MRKSNSFSPYSPGNYLTRFYIFIFLFVFFIYPVSGEMMNRKNLSINGDTVIVKKDLDPNVASLLMKMAVGRLMRIKQGNAAIENAHSPVIKEYGRKMIREHHILLSKIKKLAQSRNVVLPQALTEENKKALADLIKGPEENFDDRFVNRLLLDQDEDLKIFRRAIELSDLEVSDFALKYRPVIQSQHEQIKTIKKNMQ